MGADKRMFRSFACADPHDLPFTADITLKHEEIQVRRAFIFQVGETGWSISAVIRPELLDSQELALVLVSDSALRFTRVFEFQRPNTILSPDRADRVGAHHIDDTTDRIADDEQILEH